MGNSPITLEKARAAKAAAVRRLGNIDGINGIGLSRRGAGYAIKVNCETELPEEIPNRIEGVDVVVEVVGKIRKFRHKERATFHVRPHNGRWAVRRNGTKRVSSVHEIQREAIDVARRRARKAGGELVIHGRDGFVRSRERY